MFEFYTDADKKLSSLLEQKKLLCDSVDPFHLPPCPGIATYPVEMPDEQYSFLHEAAVIRFHGVLYASWYNNPKDELQGFTPIRGCKSFDEGKTWTDIETLAEDRSGKILYCPPVYAIWEDRLYLLMNEMVSADHIHGIDLYRLNEETGKFELLWHRPIPFKLNTNAVWLENGKMMLPGRVTELDQFPRPPAVILADNPESEYRIVYIQKDGELPDGTLLVHPEISCIADGASITMFCRNDDRQVPLIYESADFGEMWSKVKEHNIPFSSSKIYAGTLSDGRNYVIGNLDVQRKRLALFVSKKGTLEFNRGYMVQDGVSAQFGFGSMWHYPVCHEENGKLYIIYTVNVDESNRRGAVLSVIDIEKL